MNDDKAKKATIDYARARGVKFLPPHINLSDLDFKIEKSNGEKFIRYGFSKIKGLGEAIKYVIHVRDLVGGFDDFDDFMQMTRNKEISNYILNYINKTRPAKSKEKKRNPLDRGHIRSLILSGAFDCFEENRYTLYNYFVDEYLDSKSKEGSIIYDEERYNKSEKYTLELVHLGGYASGHPLDILPCDNLSDLKDKQIVNLPVIVYSKSVKKTSKGNEYMHIEFQAPNGLYYKGNLFSWVYKKHKDEVVSCNLAKNIAPGIKEADLYERVIKENKKRAKALAYISGEYSKEFNNFTIRDFRPIGRKG